MSLQRQSGFTGETGGGNIPSATEVMCAAKAEGTLGLEASDVRSIGAQQVWVLGYKNDCRNRHGKVLSQCVQVIIEKGINNLTVEGFAFQQTCIDRKCCQADHARV